MSPVTCPKICLLETARPHFVERLDLEAPFGSPGCEASPM